VALFPHFGDRAKPGVIAVDRRGRRFANEAASYHDFVRAMLTVAERDSADEFALVTSHAWLRRQGLGRVPPSPAPMEEYLRSGYLLRSDTVAGLAALLGCDPAELAETLRRFDHYAREGYDPDFARGSSRFERAAGSADHAPNPCVAPLGSGPYYAIRILPGDIGNTRGLRVDASARVLDANGSPINGLYALGNCAASLMGSSYPAAGIMLGQALTFGYLAARHAADPSPAHLEPY
jgi:succinate dehydrogenase/fumarate reductase flavoprotein subunit